MGTRGLSRRNFLHATGAAALAVGCGSDDGSGGSGDDPFAPVPVVEGTSAVGLVGVADDVETAIRRAIALAGGIEEIQPGDSVFIKPNAVHGIGSITGSAVTTNEVVAAVVRIVREREPGRIVVGDRSWRAASSSSVISSTGMGDAAMEAGADEVYAAPTPEKGPDDWQLMQPTAWEETWSAAGGILAMKQILDADHFINLPVCKNHRWAGFSLSMKNLIGAVGDDSRDPMHYTEGDPERLSRDIAILNGIFRPLINIVDAQHTLLNGGPEGVYGDAVWAETGAVFAGKDRVAVDAVGAALIKSRLADATVDDPDELHEFLEATGVWDLPQIRHGRELLGGVSGVAGLDLRSDGADPAPLEALLNA